MPNIYIDHKDSPPRVITAPIRKVRPRPKPVEVVDLYCYEEMPTEEELRAEVKRLKK